jgi:hypothetical protein
LFHHQALQDDERDINNTKQYYKHILVRPAEVPALASHRTCATLRAAIFNIAPRKGKEN